MPAFLGWFIAIVVVLVLVAAWKGRAVLGVLRARKAADADSEIGASTVIIGFWIILFAALGLGGIFAWSYGQSANPKPEPVLLAFGADVMVAFAASGVGALLGFIFGIPRTLDPASRVAVAVASQAGTPATSQAALAANTNLERVSDWLTTLLIGATLVQSEKVISWIGGLGAQFESAGLTNKTLVPLIVIYFLTLSFLGIYLVTRLYLTLALQQTLALLTGVASNAPAVVKKTLPKGSLTTDYPGTVVQAVGGTTPIRWTVNPALPAGLVLNPDTGAISGRPTVATPETTYLLTATDGATPPLAGSAEFKLEVTT